MSETTPDSRTHTTAEELDPGANTQMFQAFVAEAETEEKKPPLIGTGGLAVIAGIIVLVAIVAAILVY
jgi:hypothetical protein